jgi:hypothetical protein
VIGRNEQWRTAPWPGGFGAVSLPFGQKVIYIGAVRFTASGEKKT